MDRADPGGGSLYLGELIEEYWEELDRDFHFFHGIDLMEELWVKKETTLGPRRLLNFIQRFPEGSEFWAAQAGGREHRDWSTSVYMQASIINAVNSLTLAMTNAPKSVRTKFPMITGPEKPKQKKKTTASDILAMFSGSGAGEW